MKIFTFETYREKKNFQLFCLILFLGTVFFSVIATPIYLWSDNDITVSESIFPNLWDTVQEVSEYFWYWFSFAVLLHFLSHYGISSSLKLPVAFAFFTVLRYAGCVISGSLMLEEWTNLAEELLFALLYVIFDLLQIGMVYLIFYLNLLRKQTDLKSYFPFERIWDWKNLIFRTAFLSVCIPSFIKLITRIIYDLNVGMPSTAQDRAGMIIAYTTDFISIVIGYLVVFLILNHLDEKEK